MGYVADEITVIRDGTTIETIDNAGHDIDEDRIIRGVVGCEIEDRFPKCPGVQLGDINIEVSNWTGYHPLYQDKKVVDNVSIHVRKGDVVGISGLMGGEDINLLCLVVGIAACELYLFLTFCTRMIHIKKGYAVDSMSSVIAYSVGILVVVIFDVMSKKNDSC